MAITAAQQEMLNQMCPAAKQALLGDALANVEGGIVAADSIGAAEIDWGTASGKVSAKDVPIADSGELLTATTVEAAIAEIAAAGTDVVNAAAIGTLASLTTTDKASLVGALNEVRARLIAETDSASGADFIGTTPITGIGDANTDTVQEVLEAFDAKLKAATDSASGADYIGMTAIAEAGAGATVQAVVEGLVTRLKAVTDSASGADLIGATAVTQLGEAATVQAQIEALIALLTAETDSASGADLVAITPITAFGAADTVQEALEAIDAKLAAETDSASGADYIGITPITALGEADTVQEALEAFDTKLTAETDSASGADYVAITPITALGVADTVQEALEAIAPRTMQYIAGTLTVSAANGAGTITLADFGVNYILITSINSGPATAVRCVVTKGDGSAGVVMKDGSDQAVACDSTNAVVDYIAINTAES